LYMRQGLFPRCPIYNLQVAREAVAGGLHGERLRYVPIESTAAHLCTLAQIDIAGLGFSRAKHHRFLMADDATRGFLLHAGDDCVGYVYLADGHVGPLVVTQRAALATAFRTTLGLAAESGAPNLSAFLPGPCGAALAVTLATGMRITSPMMLMATCDFGNWAQYLPRNPGFM
jgi:hypothetical protein